MSYHVVISPRLAYKTLFGGVEGFWVEHYHKVNGFPNRFWGWGGEDDDLYARYVKAKNVKTKRWTHALPAIMCRYHPTHAYNHITRAMVRKQC